MRAIFTPDDEPYLGLYSMLKLDQTISLTMEQQRAIAKWTRSNQLSKMQQIASEIVPASISIVLSIRELVRQGYLLSALILLRPLFERSATLAYLLAHEDERSKWETGWKHGDRPTLRDRAATMAPREVSCGGLIELDTLINRNNSLVHGDPHAALHGTILLDDGSAGFTSSKDVDSPSRADAICKETFWRLAYLNLRSHELFGTAAPISSDHI